MIYFITASIRSLREGNVFSRVCLSVSLSNSMRGVPCDLFCWKDLGRRLLQALWDRSHGTPLEGLAGKDCWKDLGRKAWAPPPGLARKDCGKDLGRKVWAPPCRRTSWEGLLEGPGKEGLGTPLPEGLVGKDCRKDLERKAWAPPQKD